MSDANSSPVTLAAGSYDYDALKSGLNKAANGAAKNYDGAVADAVDAAGDNVHKSQDARDIAGYEFVDVENEDLGVTETIQVFNAKLAAKTDDGDGAEISDADLRNQQAKTSADAVAKVSSTKE